MPVDPALIIQRFNRLLAKRENYEPTWEQIADQILPQRTGIISTFTPGEKRTRKLFDGTAPHSALLLASTMHSTLTPSGLEWFSIKYRDEAINENKEVMDWTDDSVRRAHQAITNSTYDLHAMENFLDLVAFACCALQVEERPRVEQGWPGLQFQSIPIGTFVVDEDAQGQVDTVARSFSITARAAIDRWGAKAVTQSMREALPREPEKPFTIIHWVGPRPREERTGRFRAMPFVSAYIDLGSKALIGREGGFHELPYMVPRWGKATGETYGYGPGQTALPFVQSLNEATRLFLKSMGKAVDPPTASRWNGVVGPIRWHPGGNTVLRDINDFKEFPPQARYDVTQAGILDLRTEVRRAFFVDQLALKETPQMTAMEVQVRFELMQRVLGPTLGRLRGEYFNPMITRIMGIMMRAGQLLPVPRILADYIQQVGEWDYEYEGPMARAQRSPELVAVERSYQLAGLIAGIYPQVFDNFDHDRTARHVWRITGAPEDGLRGEKDVAAIRQGRQREKQEALLAQTVMGGSEVAKNIAPIAKVVADAGRNGGVIPAEQAR